MKNREIVTIFVDEIPSTSIDKLKLKYDHFIIGSNLYIIKYYELYSCNILIAIYNRQSNTFYVEKHASSSTLKKHISLVLNKIRNAMKLNSNINLERVKDIHNQTGISLTSWR